MQGDAELKYTLSVVCLVALCCVVLQITVTYCKYPVEPTPPAEPPSYTNVFGGVSVPNDRPAINP